MLTLIINDTSYILSDYRSERKIKEAIKDLPKDTKVSIPETDEVLTIEDIFGL